jgi:protein-disulfide isomerase
MRTIIVPLFCLILGLGVGYMLNQSSVTPAMIEESVRKNPRLIMDLLHQYPEELFDIVVTGQESKREAAIQEQREADLRNPIVVHYEEGRSMLGDPDAPITIVEFSDFQCPHCSKANAVVKEVLEKYKGTVKVVFMHMPLQELGVRAAAYFEAAQLQDPQKAWMLHDLLFAGREAYRDSGEAWLKDAAQSIGLDVERLEEDAASELVLQRIQAHVAEAERIGLRGTPSFIVGGVLLPGYAPLEEFSKVVDMVIEHRNATATATTPEADNATAPAQ